MFNKSYEGSEIMLYQVDELMSSLRASLYSNTLSGISLFGFFMTFDEFLLGVSIFSAVLSSVVSMTSLFRFYVFLRDRRSEEISRGNKNKLEV